MPSKRDYYEVLGVGRDATEKQIKAAFRKMAFKYHPDRNGDDGAEARFKEINEAYEVLCDTERRDAYDRYGHAGGEGLFGRGFEGFGFDGVGSIFDAFFGGRTSTATRQAPVRGADIHRSVTITLEDAAFGVENEVSINRIERCSECQGNGSRPGAKPGQCPECKGAGQVRRVQQSIFGRFTNITSCPRCQGEGRVITDPCTRCRGSGKEKVNRNILVKIPAGVDDGSRMRLTGEGDAGTRGGSPGNLYVDITVNEHEIFMRNNDDILFDLPVNFTQVALGSELEVPTLNGNVKLKIPAGSQAGQVFKLKNMGIPHLHRRGQGSQLVRLKVITPESLSKKQRKLLEELAEEWASGKKK